MALDEQMEMARELGLSIDTAGFDEAMAQQRARARASWKGAEKSQVAPVYQELLGLGRTEFLGYDTLAAGPCQVLAILVEQQRQKSVEAGAECEIVLDRTPFYAESGGQVGDNGVLIDPETGLPVAQITTTYSAIPGLTVHKAKIMNPLKVDALLQARAVLPSGIRMVSTSARPSPSTMISMSMYFPFLLVGVLSRWLTPPT